MLDFYYSFDHLQTGTSVLAQIAGPGAFDSIDTGNISIAAGPYNQILTFTPTSGGSVARLFTKVIPSGIRRLCMGALYKHHASVATSGTIEIMSWRDGANAQMLNLAMTSAGSLVVRRGTSVLGTVPGTYNDDSYRYLELVGFVDGTNGYVEVWIEGSLALTLTNVNTGSADIGSVVWYAHKNNGLANVLILAFGLPYVREWEDSVTPNPHGPLGAVWRPVTADVGTPDWTPDSGTDNYARVGRQYNAAPAGGNISTVDTGDVDKYSKAAIPATISAITCVSPVTVAVAPSGGAPEIQCDMEDSGASNVSTGPSLICSSAGLRSMIFPILTKPGGGAWTRADVDDANIVLTASV